MFKKKFPSLSSLGSDGNTAFLRAARAGHLDKVLEHLKSNIDINTSNSNGLNALHLASKDGHVNVVTELLKRGAIVDAATKKGNTALHIASLAGQEEVVKLLVANGAAVNVQSQNGFTPLYMAAQENHDNVVRFLLANGANQSLATEDGFTPLAVAMQQGHDKVVTVLLENDTRGKVRLPALHIAAKKDDCKAAALLLQNDHNPDVTSKSGFTPLHIAAHYGNESIANLLLNRGADVNYSAKHNITPLHVAAKWGKTNMVSLLLEKGANIESKTRDGLTPLHCAARSGHEQVVDMMLERGAPISSKTKNGLAPLHMASQGDHVDAARILLYHRAPVDEVTVDYLTALHVAAHCGHVRVAKLLLDRKADPNARALNGFTPLHIACKKNRIKVVELLLKHGASIEATTESGLTPLHVASFMGCMNIVIYLLQHDASPDVPTVRGETPLHLAARANQTDIIRILLRNGAQVDARAREQQTPLHIASRLGNVDIVMLLLQHGAAVDSTTKDMYTALHIAGKEGQEEVASVLLEHGASLTATTKKGFTPLHLAAKYGNMKVAKLLLQRDAPVDAQGKNGVTPLHVASHYDHQNVALLLLDKGASPHATAKNGHTPLHIAARKNQMDIATTLLEYGAKANAESKAGFTPLHLSSQEGHTDMSTLLIEHQADTNHKAKNGLTPLHLCAQEDRVNVASILVKNGAEVDSTTKAGYTPLHVASHFGQINMVRFLLQHGADVKASTSIGYTPLHQAAQQGHTTIVNLLLENSAPPNSLTNQGQTALSIAQKLGYISVVETLKVVTDTSIPSNVTPGADEKYRVVAPETMQETFMSDSEDEGGEDTMLSDQPYRYLTVDEMKSLGDDSLPIDVTRDERVDSNRECMAPPTAVDDTISPQHVKESYAQFTATNYTPDNIDINRHPIHVGFLVSFLVDARGGAMRGCRHSGVRVIVPPRKAAMPMRVTCRYLKRDKLSHPPPLMEGEALASRILELGPVGAKFLGPVIIEVPHFGSLRGMEREIVILRSDNGETWREHTLEASEEAVHEVLNESFEGEELTALEESSSGRMTRILTTDFPQYFAVVSRIRQEVHAIGPEGGMVSSSVVPQVQAVFPQGALTKKIKVGLQAQPIAAELAAKLLGNRVAVSPIVTVEPRRRKFHKPITLTIPVPQAANKGMINQYSGDAPTLRLLCSITGGTTRAQWEDVTGSTPLTFVNDCVSFTTTVSARFWLMDCRNIGEATKMATELYKEAIHVPFMAKFVVFAKRVDVLEARLRVFCMTDDKEDKTLEHQEHFTEVAKSRDVEVLEGKSQYIEFAGNLVPVTKSGDQLQLGFRAFRENRLPFTVRVKDPHADTVGRILFMREPKVAKGEPPQQPICILNIVLPETILPESTVSEPDLLVLHKKYSFLRDGGLGRLDTTYQRTDLRLSDISNLLGEDWVPLASELGITTSDVNLVKSECPSSVAQQAMAMLRLWLQQAGNKATGNVLETALRKIGRDDIVQQCIFNVDEMDRAVAKVQLDQSGFESLKEELGPSRDASLRRDASLDITYDEQDIMKESESVEELVQAEKKEPYEDRLPKPAISKDKQERDIEEIKYIGEEKVVEEERKTVAQLKEIFAQDKRDRQYERQPLLSEQLPTTPPAKPKKEKVSPPSISEDISKVSTITEDSIAATIEEVSQVSKMTIEDGISTIEEDISKKEPSPPHTKARTEADQRRDSELFQGVTDELVRLETTYKVIPAAEELMSPKVSKTPPPSPAEFRETTGGTTWQQGDVTTSEQLSPPQEWTKKSQEKDKHFVTTKTDLMLTTSPVSVAAERSGSLGTQGTKHSPCQFPTNYEKFRDIPDTTMLITETLVSQNIEALPLTVTSPYLFQNSSVACDDISYKSQEPVLTQNQELNVDSHIPKVEELTPTIDSDSDSSVGVETLNINISKEVPLRFVKDNTKQHRSSIHIQANFDPFEYLSKQTLEDKLNEDPVQISQLTTVADMKGNTDTSVSAIEYSDSLFKHQHEIADKCQLEDNKLKEKHTSKKLHEDSDLMLRKENELKNSSISNSKKVISSLKEVNKSTASVSELHPPLSNVTVSPSSCGNAELEELEATVERILSEVAVQESLLDSNVPYDYHAELRNEIKTSPQVEKHVNVLNVIPNEETVIELLPRKKDKNKRDKEKNDEANQEKSSNYKLFSPVSSIALPEMGFFEKKSCEHEHETCEMKCPGKSHVAYKESKDEIEAKEGKNQIKETVPDNIIKFHNKDSYNSLSSCTAEPKVTAHMNREKHSYDPPTSTYSEMQDVALKKHEPENKLDKCEWPDILKPNIEQEDDIHVRLDDTKFQESPSTFLNELYSDPFICSRSHIAEQEVTDKMNEAKAPYNIPVTPRSVKQRSALKHNKSEGRGVSLYDYKWPENWPDEDLNSVPDDLVMLMSDDEMNDDFKDNWSSIWPIDSKHLISKDVKEDSSKCNLPKESTHASLKCLQNYSYPTKSDFDDDIEASIFDEDNPQHSIHELEETVSQLVSDVEMDETQLLKHLSSLENVSMLKEKDLLLSSVMQTEKLVTEVALPDNLTEPQSTNDDEDDDHDAIKAEVKLLVKMTDSGKEAIEIHSVKENPKPDVVPEDENISLLSDSNLQGLNNSRTLKNVKEFNDSSQTLEQINILQLNNDSPPPFKFEICSESNSPQKSDQSVVTNIFENIQIENDFTKNVEASQELDDSKPLNVFSEKSEFPIQRLLIRSHGNEPENITLTKQNKTRKKKPNKLKSPKQQMQCSEDKSKQQTFATCSTAEHKIDNQSNKSENNINQAKDKFQFEGIQNPNKVLFTEKLKEKTNEAKVGGQKQNSGMEKMSQYEKHEHNLQDEIQEKVTGAHPKRKHRKHKKKPKQQEYKQENQHSQQIQRLFIRTPDITLNEPLDMLPVKENSNKPSKEPECLKHITTEEKEKTHEIKKLLVRTPGSEDFLTFPVISISRSLSPDLYPLSISPPPPPQQLPKTKLFANLPKVPLASEEDLRSLSPVSSNISLQNLLISFLATDESADSSDGSDTFIQPARWLSLPSLVVRSVTPMAYSTNTISMDNILISPSLSRVVSLPSLQTSQCATITDVTESTDTSLTTSDKKSKTNEDWASLLDEEDEIPPTFYKFYDTSPPVTEMNPQKNFASSKSPRSRRRRGKKPTTSPSTSLDALPDSSTPSFSPNFSRRNRRKSPANVFGSSYANYTFGPDTPTPPRSPGAKRRPRHYRASHKDPPSHSQSTSCIPNAFSDPWYLQTEFLLSPSVIPSGYCTWVPNPDQQANNRGDLVLGDLDQHQTVSREEPVVQREEGEGVEGDEGEQSVQRHTTQTRVVDGGKVTTTTTTTTTTKISKVSGDSSDAEKKPE